MAHLAGRIIDRYLSMRYRRRLDAPTVEESQLIESLRRRLGAIVPPCSPDSSVAAKAWDGYAGRLVRCASENDPRAFLNWPVVREAMFIASGRIAWRELAALRRSSDWRKRWSKAIVETSVGSPQPFLLYPRSSGNLIHHAYHLAQFEERMGVQVHSYSTVFEFGGGYGSMCRLFHNLGFGGSYIILDLPACSALQEYYLKSIGIGTGRSKHVMSVHCASSIEEIRQLVGDRSQPALFLATWSLSETPVDQREAIVPLISDFDAFLIAYQARFREVNNVEYFDTLQTRVPFVEWATWEIDHMPGNYYLVGKRRIG